MLSKRIKELLIIHKMTKEELAEKCGLPIETVRNIYYGKTTDPKVSTLIKISNVLNTSVNSLMGESVTSDERKLLEYYNNCGLHGKSLILLTAKYEALTAKNERESKLRHTIPCLVPYGNIIQGIVYDTCKTEEIYITNKDAYTAIKITTNDLLPIYCKGDIILIANRFPENGEHGVFYGNGKAYIRQFIEESNGYILKSLHNQSEDMVFNRMNEIEYIGTCCDVVRT